MNLCFLGIVEKIKTEGIPPEIIETAKPNSSLGKDVFSLCKNISLAA